MILLVTIWIQPRLSFARVSWYISSMNIFLLLSNKYVCIENYFILFHLRKTHQLNIFLVLSYVSFHIEINITTSKDVLLFICEGNIGHYL